MNEHTSEPAGEQANGPSGEEPAYRVVRNDEEQYSIWWAGRELPAGWHAEGTEGTREDCLAHIDTVWTDLRPLSLRRRMAEAVSGS
ncbi:putative MbtH-like protein [Streptomyces sp. Tu6071]|uniref:MbtH family NRPS accessory protein n=1 Tax=Streptomyces evansiae TaxID=3075535 RepID=A0ABD5DXE3_9ACTN|nr:MULTISPECIES: MbtH family NRPS accessory protein [unclassified Streptomyces]ASY35139.1 antibiotic synthesis protein MbtH [Streptomyces sp. CLI2509]EGJ77613.1 putative MbtH-like protein [Streptomyces sp. Tu6071]MDT0413884.1 MbtH family NRPS accessory protein [Streptomyces sp. DSM 41982]MYX21750.1 MbtH family NRPS accessory protein [Streptomyces sp. SID8380]SCD79147.1 MbtH protein [Streptomyces sp. SolWspMP-sol7th]